MTLDLARDSLDPVFTPWPTRQGGRGHEIFESQPAVAELQGQAHRRDPGSSWPSDTRQILRRSSRAPWTRARVGGPQALIPGFRLEDSPSAFSDHRLIVRLSPLIHHPIAPRPRFFSDPLELR